MGEIWRKLLKKIYRKLKKEGPEKDPIHRLSIEGHVVTKIANPQGLIHSHLGFGSVRIVFLGYTLHLATNLKRLYRAYDGAKGR